MKIRPLFKLCDFWVGLYWDREKRRLYVLPVPCLGFYIQFRPKKETLPQPVTVTVPYYEGPRKFTVVRHKLDGTTEVETYQEEIER